MKRTFIKIYIPSQVLEKVQEKASGFGLPVSQYVKFIVLRDVDPYEREFSRQKILDKIFPE